MEPAEKLSVTVTPAMAKMIREKVEQGSYGSASEVVRAALRALTREDEQHAEQIASIRARVQASLEDPRPRVPAEQVFGDLRRKLAGLMEGGDAPIAGRLRR